MIKSTNQTQKGHGFFRKTKAYGLACGIVLGFSILSPITTVLAETGTTVGAAASTVVSSTIPSTPPAETKTIAQLQTPEQIAKLKEAIDDAFKTIAAKVVNKALDQAEEAYNQMRAEQIELHKTYPNDVKILPELTLEKPVISKSDVTFNYNRDSLKLNADGTFTIDTTDPSIMHLGEHSFLPAKMSVSKDVEKKVLDYYNAVVHNENRLHPDEAAATSLDKVLIYIGFDDAYHALKGDIEENDLVKLKGVNVSRVLREILVDKINHVKPDFPMGILALQMISYVSPVMKNGSDIAKGSVTQRFVDEKGNELSTKTTGSVPYGSTISLTHENSMIVDGKQYAFKSQDIADLTTVDNTDKVVTYTYTLVQAKPDSPIVETLEKVYRPNPNLDPGTQNIVDQGKPKKTRDGKVIDAGTPQVIDVGTKPKVEEEKLPFEKKTRENPDLPEGASKIVQVGKDGKKVTTATYTLDAKTGKVTPDTPKVETTPAVDQITEIGTGKDKDGDLVVKYIPDPESPKDKETIVDEGQKPKLDVTGKEKDPGRPKVVKVGTKPDVVTEKLPFKEKTVENPDKPEGYRNVLKEGKEGKKTTTTTYTLDTKTGKVTADKPTVETIDPEDRVIEIGTGKNVTGEIVTQYVPGKELEPGKTKVVQEGTPEVRDVTGKIVTPGKPTIIHVGIKPKVVEESIPFAKEYKDNPDLPEGTEKIIQKGENGKKVTTTTYTLDEKTGKVSSTNKVDTTPAKNEIVERGRGKNKTSEIVVNYIPDEKLEPGKKVVVDEGTPEVRDVTGKVLTEGEPKVIKVGIKPKVVEEELPFKEEVRENPKLPKGTEFVVQQGEKGKKTTTTTYTLDPKTGEVTPTEKVTTKDPKNRIIERGTGEDVDGEIVVTYIPDPENESGKQTIVDEGLKPKIDVTGKVKDPGKPRVIKVGTKPKVDEETLEFKVVKRDNPDLPKGEEKIVQQGQKGKKTTTTTYTLDPKTGKVTSSSKTETKDPIDQIVEIGTGEDVEEDLVTIYKPDLDSEAGTKTVEDEGIKAKKDSKGKILREGKPRIIKVGTKTKVSEEKLPYKEQTRETDQLPEGERRIVQQGKDGKKVTTTTFTLDEKTGEVTSSSTDSVEDPIDQIVEVGIKKVEEPKKTEEVKKPAAIKGKTPAKYADTNEAAGIVQSVIGALGLTSLAGFCIWKKRKK